MTDELKKLFDLLQVEIRGELPTEPEVKSAALQSAFNRLRGAVGLAYTSGDEVTASALGLVAAAFLGCRSAEERAATATALAKCANDQIEILRVMQAEAEEVIN